MKPGIDFAKVHTCRTWSMNFSENCSRKKASGRPFMGHETTVWKRRILAVERDTIWRRRKRR